jgi:hypothetical protein
MSARTVVLAVVGTGCIVAAGVGGFVAMRLSVPARGAEATQTPAIATPAQAPATSATDTAPAPEPTTEVATTPAETPAPVSSPTPRANSRTTKTRKPAPPASQPTPEPTPPAAVAAPVPTPTPETAPPPPDEAIAPPPTETPKPRFEELTIVENSVIGIHLDQTLSSSTAKVEDKVTAKVTRDVMVGGRTAIPAGSTLEGNVTLVDRGGKFKERARLGIKFTSLVLPDNMRQPIQTEALFRDGEAPTSEATSKVGASAAIGAILGALVGGKKGAAIGTAAGAAGGTAAVAAGGKNDAVFAANAPLTVRLTSPVTVTIERQPQDVRH